MDKLQLYLMHGVVWLVISLISGLSFAESNTLAITEKKPDTPQYYSDHSRGWFWYEAPAIEEKETAEKKAEKKTPEVAAVLSAPVLTPRETLKKQGEAWEDALANAILRPSQENYAAYLAQTAKIQAQSQAFSSGFKQALWVTPEYDYTLQHPITTQAIVANNQQKKTTTEKQLAELSQKDGILFFFRSDCPYCHRFAPVLKHFSAQYGFTVIPVSLDGAGIAEYPQPKTNYDIGRKLNVSVVPAIFLVDPQKNAVATVGYGYSDFSALTEKILSAAEQLSSTANVRVGDSR